MEKYEFVCEINDLEMIKEKLHILDEQFSNSAKILSVEQKWKTYQEGWCDAFRMARLSLRRELR